MAALPPGGQLVLARVYTDRANFIRRVLGGAALAAYEQMDPFDAEEVDDFVDRMMAMSAAGQRAMVSTLSGYLFAFSEEDIPDWDPAEAEDEFTGDATVPEVGLERTWRIPFFSFWGALGAGLAVELAREALRSNLDRTAQSLLSFSQANAMQALAARLDIGYQRVRAGLGCDFCNEDPGHVFRDEPMPLHIGCRCSVMPVQRGA